MRGVAVAGLLMACAPPSGTLGTMASEDSSQQPAMLTVEVDVGYAPPAAGDPAMSTVDLYYVPDGQPKRLLVFVHGGSWVGGDKSNLESTPVLVSWFLKRDFVVAAPNFRLAVPHGPIGYPEMATDVAHALAWLDEHGPGYGVTERGMVLMGYSSGAHLVALLGADHRYLEAVGLSSQADLTATMSFDVHAYDVPYALELMAGSELERNIPLIEGLFGTTVVSQNQGSPAHFVEAGATPPPAFLLSADPSTTPGSKGFIARAATGRYAERLEAAGHTVSALHFDGETHGSLVMDFGAPEDGPTRAVASFLDLLDGL